MEQALSHTRRRTAHPQTGARRDRPHGERARRSRDDPRDRERYLPSRARSGSPARGRSIEAIATAALYAATKAAGAPRTIDEVAAVSRIDRTEFTRAYRYVVRELGLEIVPAGSAQHLPRYVSELDLSGETERRARELLRAGKESGIHSGRNPVGLAVAAIYAGATLTNETLTQETVPDATDISTVTIRTRYKQLLEADGAGF